MLKNIKFKLGGQLSQNDKILIETEIDVLAGVKDIRVDYQTGDCLLELDDQKTSTDKILQALSVLGFHEIYQAIEPKSASQEYTYFVRGMHCASCEILIEKNLLKIKGITSVEASTTNGEVVIEYESRRPTGNELNQIFKNSGYSFFEQPIKNEEPSTDNNIFKSFFYCRHNHCYFYSTESIGIKFLGQCKFPFFSASFFLPRAFGRII